MKHPGLLALTVAFVFAACAGPPGPSTAPATEAAAAEITPAFLREMVTRLAADDMEGRGPGSRGDRAAREFLAATLDSLGYAPGAPGGGWEQRFPIVGLTSHMPPSWTFESAGERLELRWWDEYIAASGRQQPRVAIDDAEIVFVGYAIDAPEENWDDFKGVDVEGKILLVLNNDPDWDPGLFAGERRLYYGRWRYKYESAAPQGAARAIIIHTTPSAGYPWPVVQNSWTGEQFELPAGDEPRVGIQAWVTEDAAERLVALGGLYLEELIAAARSRDFRPLPLGVHTSIRFDVDLKQTETGNVLGTLRGSDPELAEQFVVFSAHHDHLGIGEPDETGDTVYNGALDNGVAMAQALAVARAFAELPQPPRRSLLFAFVGAEEQGLLGSGYFARHPTVPPGRLAADINFELGNVWGRTRDVTVYGKGKSTLEDVLARAAERQGRVVVGEPDPDRGWYYRSDQFSFASVGVPALWFKSGTDFIDKPAGWGRRTLDAWIENNYHRPTDEVDEAWVYDGLVEDAKLAFAVGLEVANADAMPTWYPGDEFEEARRRALAELDTP